MNTVERSSKTGKKTELTIGEFLLSTGAVLVVSEMWTVSSEMWTVASEMWIVASLEQVEKKRNEKK